MSNESMSGAYSEQLNFIANDATPDFAADKTTTLQSNVEGLLH